MSHSIVSSRALWLAAAALLLAGCSDTGPARLLSLSVSTRSVSAASPAPGLYADIVIGSGPNSLTIKSVQVELSEIELSTGGSCSPTDEHDGCDELEVGPVSVDLPVDGTTKPFLDKVVPPGTYTGLEAKLDSVHVTGVFTDAGGVTHDFELGLRTEAEIEAAFQSPVTVDATTSNLTINVDVASWFKDAAGAVIDPTNQANVGAIEQNIQRSFHAFEDDNHDGEDDATEQGGGH